ncbi:hypothetical protein ACWDBO_31185 [Streptomyces mirabilis]|uniref:hypothetical protein n=1 Tax=Streptomyces mirabilis TaxID=68239 RepID=UPI0033213351
MEKTYQFIDADQDIADAELINDKNQGPVIWLQTSPDGCYIPVARLAEFIDGLKATAAAETAADSAA